MHYFSSLFVKELYMFRTDLLSIIGSLNAIFTAIGICHTCTSYVDCLLARWGWSSIMTSLADRQHNSMTNSSCCEYTIKTPDDGQYICPKHLEFFNK